MTPPPTIRVLVNHADPLLDAGLRHTLAGRADLEVLEARVSGPAGEVDVLATDLASGIAFLRSAGTAGAHAGVLVVTTSDRESDIRHALERGVYGYLLHTCALDEVADAVRNVARRSVHLGAAVAQRLAESIHGSDLTMRERQVLDCVIHGLCNKQIARRLDLTVGTIKSHLRSIYAKLDVGSRTQAVAVARRRGLLPSASAPSEFDDAAAQGQRDRVRAVAGVELRQDLLHS